MLKHQGSFSGGLYSHERLKLPSLVATPEIERCQRPVVSQKSIETAICHVPAVAIRRGEQKRTREQNEYKQHRDIPEERKRDKAQEDTSDHEQSATK